MLALPLDQLLLALPVHDEHDGPAAWLQKSDHPVLSLGPQLVDDDSHRQCQTVGGEKPLKNNSINVCSLSIVNLP